jgi:DNA-binding winged helix-turn-helix (wHTH) protein
MNQRVIFGQYQFEPATLRLARAARGQAYAQGCNVLRLLIIRAGQPVTKQELFSSIWGNTVVTDDALVSCIQELRKAPGR